MRGVDAIYWLAVETDEGYPRIDFSHPRNRSTNWLDVAQMIDGERPVDIEYLQRAEIAIELKRGQRHLGVDALWFEHRILVSPLVRKTIDGLGLSDISYLPLNVNAERFFALMVTRTIDCLDIERSKLEYFVSNPSRVMRIQKHVFRKVLVPDPCIFYLPENRARVFATPAVMAAFEQTGAIGLRFIDLEKEDRLDS